MKTKTYVDRKFENQMTFNEDKKMSLQTEIYQAIRESQEYILLDLIRDRKIQRY